ncbi:hypothetical protein NSU_2267 [Novosphingobium pentaromativorans US6-1]|uniref:Uncharacterized protein n=1 Tax=Novosphingobium pentaromativorans US6-1 TaxID=1088721 RepID=G6ED46_9SPHN|nr:hypothetical protein NSU_2267 [Novosphingobium pentaromativorans US6-1]
MLVLEKGRIALYREAATLFRTRPGMKNLNGFHSSCDPGPTG